MRIIQERIDQCRVRYWNLDKETRIDHDLRPEVGGVGYSATSVMTAAEAVINSAFRGDFPIVIRDRHVSMSVSFDAPQLLSAKTPGDLVDRLEPLIADLEMRLNAAYAATNLDNNQDKGS